MNLKHLVTLLCVGAIALPAWGDSLFHTAMTTGKGTLIAKDTQLHVGDLITVQVHEMLASSMTSNTHTKKLAGVQSLADPSTNSFLINQSKHGPKIIPPQALPNWNIQTTNESNATGDIVRNSQLQTSLSCVITEIMPSGMVRIDGGKTVSVNREDCKLHVTGLVRIVDLTPANTIDSSQIANAVIDLKGKGPLWNNQRRGLLTRLLDWFAPY